MISGTKNLTRGSMTANLLTFAMPFLLANLIQAMYGAVDLWVVGKFGGAGEDSVAAVANGGEVMHLVMSFIMGLTTGATVLIGRYFSSGDKRNTSRCIGMVLSFSLLVSVFVTAVLVLLAPFFVWALRVPENAVAGTVEYLAICSWGVVFIIGYNALAAIFRGLGNSMAPLVFVGISCFCNIVGDVLLVAQWGMGVRGAAIATVISQALSTFLALAFLWKGKFGFKFALPNFRINWNLVWQYLKVGIPIGLQSILIGLSFLFIVSIVNAMGGENSAPAAGYGIVNRLNGFAMLPAMSFAMALSALTAQNMGANKPVRAIKTLWVAIGYTWTAGLIFFALLQLFPEQLVGMFIDPESKGADEVIRNGVLYARSFSFDYILVPIVFCTNGFFNGCGRSFFSMMNNIVCTFLFRVPFSYIFSIMAGATLFHVGLAAPMASVASNIVALIYLFSGRWKDKRKPALKG